MYRIFKVVLIFIIFVLIFGFVIWKLFGNCQFGNCYLVSPIGAYQVKGFLHTGQVTGGFLPT
jgi:hypothetical protein